MTTFDRIAKDLLRVQGYRIYECFSEKEAIQKAAEWTEDKPYPIFSVLLTPPEKSHLKNLIQKTKLWIYLDFQRLA